jgi:hypothetical protein
MPSREESSQSHRKIKRSVAKNSTEPSKKKKINSKHYCSEHGYNPTHATADCYTLKNRAKATYHAPRADKRSFSNQKSPQGDQPATQDIIHEEDSGDVCLYYQERASRVGWKKKKPEKCKKNVAPNSKSDDEMSVQVICAPKYTPKRKSTTS